MTVVTGGWPTPRLLGVDNGGNHHPDPGARRVSCGLGGVRRRRDGSAVDPDQAAGPGGGRESESSSAISRRRTLHGCRRSCLTRTLSAATMFSRGCAQIKTPQEIDLAAASFRALPIGRLPARFPPWFPGDNRNGHCRASDAQRLRTRCAAVQADDRCHRRAQPIAQCRAKFSKTRAWRRLPRRNLFHHRWLSRQESAATAVVQQAPPHADEIWQVLTDCKRDLRSGSSRAQAAGPIYDALSARLAMSKLPPISFVGHGIGLFRTKTPTIGHTPMIGSTRDAELEAGMVLGFEPLATGPATVSGCRTRTWWR